MKSGSSMPDKIISSYKITDTLLGRGNFAEVRIGTNTETGEDVAIKIINKKQIPASDKPLIERELKVLKEISHQNLIRVLAITEDTEHHYVISELGGKDLYDHLDDVGRMSERQAKKIFLQVLDGLDYLHNTCHIAHRDIKLENILWDGKRAKIIDLGLCDYTTNGLLKTWCGSPLYASPELIGKKPYQGPEVDIWALGVVLYTLVTGSQPFFGDTIKDIFDKILNAQASIPDYLSPQLSDLLSKMLTKDGTKRISIAEIKKHPWMTSYGTFSREVLFKFKNLFDFGKSHHQRSSSGSPVTKRRTVSATMT